MRIITIIVVLLVSNISMSQNSEELEVKNTVIKFFDAFHKQDSIAIKEIVSKNVILQTIGKNKDGVTKLRDEDFSSFLKSIVAIPKDKKFEEKLLDFKIKVDGDMANAWTPYEFYFDGKFSHCGVNSFQMVRLEDSWKIIYLIDTRRRGDCK